MSADYFLLGQWSANIITQSKYTKYDQEKKVSKHDELDLGESQPIFYIQAKKKRTELKQKRNESRAVGKPQMLIDLKKKFDGKDEAKYLIFDMKGNTLWIYW